jgi:cytochrome b6-f complex iron-sulfur subunit
MKKTGDLPDSLDRRRVLALFGAAGCSLAGMGSVLVGCGGGSGAGGPREPVTIDRARLEREGRVVVRWGDEPVEVKLQGSSVEARSLVCTHIGCVVRWDPEKNLYVCPCHEGRFDSAGRPVGGPPTKPLRSVELRVTDSEVVVGPAPA